MKNAQMHKLEKLRSKESSLILAHRRVDVLIKDYITQLPNWEATYSWDFNLLHDLQDRLEDRIKDVQSEYYDIHWDMYGFNAYNF